MKASEAREQEAVVRYCEWRKVPIFHIPNGGKRNAREAANLKRQGVKAGVPDLFVPVARGGKHGRVHGLCQRLHAPGGTQARGCRPRSLLRAP